MEEREKPELLPNGEERKFFPLSPRRFRLVVETRRREEPFQMADSLERIICKNHVLRYKIFFTLQSKERQKSNNNFEEIQLFWRTLYCQEAIHPGFKKFSFAFLGPKMTVLANLFL